MNDECHCTRFGQILIIQQQKLTQHMELLVLRFGFLKAKF